jgi:hypothetical protein
MAKRAQRRGRLPERQATIARRSSFPVMCERVQEPAWP